MSSRVTDKGMVDSPNGVTLLAFVNSLAPLADLATQSSGGRTGISLSPFRG